LESGFSGWPAPPRSPAFRIPKPFLIEFITASSVILLGAFLVPIPFTTYLYERLPNWNVSLPALAVCFLWGGVLGTVVAGTLEYDVARALDFLPKLAIGLIEESAKLIVPLGFYFFGRYRSEAAGIVLGVATAAGFA
jgi:RsiW-degrading membrane proteinase PrsW (M82 family)